jgi:hypothetical protein
LTGKIPDVIQLHFWNSFDLSYNKFSGILNSNFPFKPTNSSTTLEVNRLSGDIPKSLQKAQQISLLNSNIFTCGIDRRVLPEFDTNSAHYQCGSNSFNYAIYIFIGCCGLFLLGCIVLYMQMSNNVKNIQFKSSEMMIETESVNLVSREYTIITYVKFFVSCYKIYSSSSSSSATGKNTILYIFIDIHRFIFL